MIYCLFLTFIISYILYKTHFLTTFINATNMAAGDDDATQKAPAPVVKPETKTTPAPVPVKTYLYHYNGVLVADDLENLKAAALKIAHERRDFLRLKDVSKKIDKTGRRWSSDAKQELDKLSPDQLIAYIEGRPYSNIK